MTNLIAKIVDLTNGLREICKSYSTFNVRINSNSSQVFINTPEVFFANFSTYCATPYKSFNSFNYEISTEIEGVKFYTLLTQSEYEKYVVNPKETR
ncbi:hypothetical protein [Rummeliibacillus sp. POC4]|uniref:hypothetical protein n=1 Tax=Rummeliibacillus sp. POC4 TaxID=2305899 RepID=UPI000E6765F9|nr:hypothetical protein [Rummeliibacillus sp. POC4]RIJ63128.1 hypothetical protein D1606_16635 [Rummeliibacillus sp. POC4]